MTREEGARHTWFSSSARPPSAPAATALQSPLPAGGEPDGGVRTGPGGSSRTSVAGGGERREGDQERPAARPTWLRNAAARGTAAGRGGE
jgi:hypothetical protein